jgi:hypothetical protein
MSSHQATYTLKTEILILQISGGDTYLFYKQKVSSVIKEDEKVLSLPMLQSISPNAYLSSEKAQSLNPKLYQSVKQMMVIPTLKEEKKVEITKERAQEILGNMSKSQLMTATILSLSKLRTQLNSKVWECTESSPTVLAIKDIVNKVVIPENDTMNENFVRMMGLDNKFGETMSKTIQKNILRSKVLASKVSSLRISQAGQLPHTVYTLPCGHKIGTKYFYNNAKKLKSKMPVGPLQFKCPHECYYILNDKDLAILLGANFSSVVAQYDVMFGGKCRMRMLRVACYVDYLK